MTIERQALVERLRKLATERATNGGGNDPCPPEAECDDCDSVRAMREAADALEALSSSAPATRGPCIPMCRLATSTHEDSEGVERCDLCGHPAEQPASAPVETPAYAHGFAAGWKAAIARGQQALGDLGEGAIANAYAEALESSPTDPPIPSPGDEERKDEIAKRAADATIGTVFRLPYTKARFRANLEEAAYRALSDYEIKAGAK